MRLEYGEQSVLRVWVILPCLCQKPAPNSHDDATDAQESPRPRIQNHMTHQVVDNIERPQHPDRPSKATLKNLKNMEVAHGEVAHGVWATRKCNWRLRNMKLVTWWSWCVGQRPNCTQLRWVSKNPANTEATYKDNYINNIYIYLYMCIHIYIYI